jgi:hypothetical protein
MNENRGVPSTGDGDWVQKLSERVGIRKPTHRLPDWVVQDLLPGTDSPNADPEVGCISDIPPELQRRLREEAIQQTFHRLEMPLRLLLYATESSQGPRSVQECHEILRAWRQALEREAELVPDADSGAVLPYKPALDGSYQVHGHCEAGEEVRILVPAWRIHSEVIVRGQAESLAAGDGPNAVRPSQTPAGPAAPGPRRAGGRLRPSVALALVLTVALGLLSLPSTAEVMCTCLYGDPTPASVVHAPRLATAHPAAMERWPSDSRPSTESHRPLPSSQSNSVR